MIGDVQGKEVIIVDDLIDTGGTISMASKVLIEKGAKSVRALITHPVLSGNSDENITNSALTDANLAKLNAIESAGLYKKERTILTVICKSD